MRWLLSSVAVALVLMAWTVLAQSYERVLIPIVPGTIRGAFGSEWRTTLAFSNISDTPLDVQGYDYGCDVLCGPAPLVSPHVTVQTRGTGSCRTARGDLLFVERGRTPDLAITLKSGDVSRSAERLGFALPAVTSDRLFGRTFGLNDVPMRNDYRVTLRLFDVDPRSPAAARIRVYAIEFKDYPLNKSPDRLLSEMTATFTSTFQGGGVNFCPGWAEVPVNVDTEGAASVRIEIQPLTPQQEYWAYVSVTNNQTQEVLVITPKP